MEKPLYFAYGSNINLDQMIKHFPFVDLYNIGKMNYAPSDIDWPWFGAECERLCKVYHKRYYIKEDLKKAMEGHTNEKR